MDKDEALKIVQENGLELENLPDEFKKDYEIVLEAVKNYGSALEHADYSLKKDKEIVLEAVKKDPLTIKFADISLRKKIDPSFLFSETIVYGENLCFNEFSINEDQYDIIETISQHLISKGVFNK